MVTRGLFPRLGLDHCIRSELSPEQKQGGSRQESRAHHTSWLTPRHTPPYPAHTLGTEIHAKRARYWHLVQAILHVEHNIF